MNNINDITIPENYIETSIGSKVSIRDKRWEILKKFKILNKKGLVKRYSYIVRCKNCGNVKLISQAMFSNNIIYCDVCYKRSLIGKIIGTFELIKYCETVDKHIYYDMKCTKCGKIYPHKRYDSNFLKKFNTCRRCNCPTMDPGINWFYETYKKGAINRNIPFELTYNELLSISQQPCFYCGEPPKERKVHKSKKYSIVTNGVDRIDSSKGYTIDNCVPCCTTCNLMKNSHHQNKFLSHISKIYHHSLEKCSTTIETTSNDGTE